MRSAASLNYAQQLDAFGKFFFEVHGYTPFPWQEALFERVLERGWPELIDVPTGLGKTAVLDVAVFLSAHRSEHSRRRIYLVVDRRLIVDQAYLEALTIRNALNAAQSDSACGRVRDGLAVTGDDSTSVLDVARMRGGINWSWLWLERPDRHAIVTGTVDQIGSRLLFRGYGVGERLRSIDAALVGTDSLIIVDEAHLSDPLLTTLRDAQALDEGGVGGRPIVVAMTASPESVDRSVHRITAEDEAHPVASKRLNASKSLHPVTVSAASANTAAATADALAYWARQLGGTGKVIGIVANTVAVAREAFERIRGAVADKEACVLLTGRVRPIDREYLIHAWIPKIQSGASRDESAELYVVATQTIEAGADIDLDGMVTESASLAATVQRLGRVNRFGERAETHVVVLRADKAKDPVYGPAADLAWQWMTSLVEPIAHTSRSSLADLGEGLTVSPAALRERIAEIPIETREGMRAAKPYVPVVSASALDAWARTSPTPRPDAPVAPYLHGIGVGEPTVSVVWRADIEGDEAQDWARTAERIPPSADEAVEVPISAVRRWLAQPVPDPASEAKTARQRLDLDVATSDLESQIIDEDAPSERLPAPAANLRRVLRYRGTDSKFVDPREVKPGDILIALSSGGGCDRFGWDPNSTATVTDLADLNSRRRSAVVRIGPQLAQAMRVLAPELADEIQELISQIQSDVADDDVDNNEYKGKFRDILDGHGQGHRRGRLPHERVLARLARVGRLVELTADLPDDVASSQSVSALFAANAASWGDDDSPAGSSASHVGKAIALDAHQYAVGRRAKEIARNLGLPEETVRAVELAGMYHDEGKRDRRFQVMLHRGDKWRAEAAADEPLAKSGMNPADKAALRRAARLSGYPKGMRHEAYSAKIAESLMRLESGVGKSADGVDSDLVVHLVASHHGCGRPLLPPIVDPEPREITVPVIAGTQVVVSTEESVDWDGPARFDALCRRYGRWGLALLESIVRLADIWCSARSEECDDSDN